MISGTVVDAREARIHLAVRGASGNELTIEFTVDTGFTEQLILPSAIVSALGLPYRTSTYAMVGDVSLVAINVYRAVIDWNGNPGAVNVHETEGGHLVGMGLLAGHRLLMDVADGGAVSIDPLPSP